MSRVLSAPSARRLVELQERQIWPGCVEVEIRGELDLSVIPRLQAILDRATAKDLHVLVDLTDCEFIDASGIAALVRGDEKLYDRGCQLLLFGAGGQVRRLLSVAGLVGANHGTATGGHQRDLLADSTRMLPRPIAGIRRREGRVRRREGAYPGSHV
jgi:anti-anti-sigma factor